MIITAQDRQEPPSVLNRDLPCSHELNPKALTHPLPQDLGHLGVDSILLKHCRNHLLQSLSREELRSVGLDNSGVSTPVKARGRGEGDRFGHLSLPQSLLHNGLIRLPLGHIILQNVQPLEGQDQTLFVIMELLSMLNECRLSCIQAQPKTVSKLTSGIKQGLGSLIHSVWCFATGRRGKIRVCNKIFRTERKIEEEWRKRKKNQRKEL